MANWSLWMNARRTLENKSRYKKEKTTETYSKIKNMGLDTVKWLNFSPKTKDDLDDMNQKIMSFISKSGPCLFIWDPKKSSLKKDFLVNVENFDKIEKWELVNKDNLFEYNYLITTQVLGIRNGFVGSVFSDGNGRLICETLHKSYIFNQRELSQPKEDISKNLDFFVGDNFELIGINMGLINRVNANQIIELFGTKKGYFEFSKGLHDGEIKICVIGFEELTFPNGLYDSIYLNLRKVF